LEKKKVEIKPNYIKDKMFIFVKSFIENPEFNSQTKEILKTKPSSFGSSFKLSDKFIKGMMKTGIDKEVLQFSQFKETQSLTKNNGTKKKKVRIPNLDDANYAGTSKSQKCKLFLTEGLSASNYALNGLSKIGRDYFGIFPLKGKLLNVREQSITKINNNEEINYLKEIIGLKHGYKYTNLTELRYGGIICLTDQDLDGYHIKALITNMIHTFWPELIDLGFVCAFSTPIVKTSKGNRVNEFFTITEFENWKNITNITGWNIKYFKGLGTSTSKEAKDSFVNFENKLITYIQTDDTEKDINLGFNKNLADDRKEWLLNYDKQEIIEQKETSIPISDMIHKELKHFSYYDIHRSIPSLIDGLKPTQRKILYTGFNYIANIMCNAN
jgi:DNA topoisomerase-2